MSKKNAKQIVQEILRENAMSLGDLTEPVVSAFAFAINQAYADGRRAALKKAAKAVENRQNYWADNDRITNAYYNLDLALKDIRALINSKDEE